MILKKYEKKLYVIFTFQMGMAMNGIIYNHMYNSTPKKGINGWASIFLLK